ncbi:hypothetical protein GC174_12510 [bacterium]|nr:hypothetical protein [bacterium]
MYSAEASEELKKIARKTGLAKVEAPPNDDRDNLSSHPGRQEPIVRPGGGLIIFGVMLPLLFMFYESQSHYLAKSFFDPFPTFNHYLLFSLIPVSNFLTWLAARSTVNAVYSLTALGSGMSLGIAILYSLMLLPMAPVLLFHLPFGLLLLAPLLSIPYILNAGKTICQIASRHDTFFDPHQFKHLGHIIILVMVIAVEAPSTLTRIHLADANQPDPKKSADAIAWLRTWGSGDVLLRACYERSGRATDLIGSLYEHQHPVPIDKARDIYYRVFGIPFNSVPIPSSFRGTIQHAGLISDPAGLNAGAVDEFDLDPDIAGSMVQGTARGLSLKNSIFKEKIDGKLKTATIDWTMDFSNVSTVPREARAKLLLPEGATVTGATIWIDGVEKEAKITGRARARAIYQRAVTTHKRDPLLVSMQGKDTVLVQCYPVLKGSNTRVKLSIVAPLKKLPLATYPEELGCILPSYSERNFSFDGQHALDLSAENGILISTTGEDKNQELKRFFDNNQVSRGQVMTSIKPLAFATTVRLADNSVVEADLSSRQHKRPTKLTVVVDKSIGMAPYMQDVAVGLKALKEKEPTISFTLIEVGDQGAVPLEGGVDSLGNTACAGGRPNGGAIVNLLNQAALEKDRAILWVHAAQPVASEAERSFVKRRFKNLAVDLYDLQVAAGPNALFEEASMEKNFVRVPIELKVDESLQKLQERWQDKSQSTVQGHSPALATKAFEQLHAYRNVLDRYHEGDIYGASALAVEKHLVSPVSSAVVSDVELVNKYESRRKRDIEKKTAVFKMKNILLRAPQLERQMASVAGLDSLSAAAGSAPVDGTKQFFSAQDAPALQGATNGLLAPKENLAYPASAPVEEKSADESGYAGRADFREEGAANEGLEESQPLQEPGMMVKEGSVLAPLKAQVVPEPDTLPMVLMAILALGAGFCFLKRSNAELRASKQE